MVSQLTGQSDAAPATVIGEIRLTTVKAPGVHGKEMSHDDASILSVIHTISPETGQMIHTDVAEGG